VPNSAAHLTEWTLELLAESALPENEVAQAKRHLEQCDRCSAELEAYRVLAAALSDLPRFAPSVEFSDAVMARVKMAPVADPIYTRVVRLLPTTPRGWGMLVAAAVAPALPLIALVAWVLTQPLVSIGGLWHWTSDQVVETAQMTAAYIAERSDALGLLGAAEWVTHSIQALPLGTLVLAAAVLAIAIPLSAWSLVRLVRTPMGKVTYAN
jgi:anti-sigma factor RsiW